MQQLDPSKFVASEFCHSLLGEVVIRKFFGSSIEGAKINGVGLRLEVTDIFAELATVSFKLFFLLRH